MDKLFDPDRCIYELSPTREQLVCSRVGHKGCWRIRVQLLGLEHDERVRRFLRARGQIKEEN